MFPDAQRVSFRPPERPISPRRNPWFCRHLHAGFYFLNALDDHFLAGFQPEVITQSVPTRGPTCTGRISAFPSVPTMAS